ncbi:PH-domain-containing protein [Backusella circina FSU 941]|nr:PH-domain-containing protein [Backusella circina FSU 941]
MSGHTQLRHDKRVEPDHTSLSDTSSKARKPSLETRRRSHLLYLEKYGLTQPDWHKVDAPNDDDQEDHRPLSQHLGRMTLEPESYIKNSSQFAPNIKSISDSPIKKPLAVRNMVQNNNKRPARFVKPAPQNFADNTIPSEFVTIQQLIDAYHNKVYTEGYLEKRNDVTSSGTAYSTRQWNKWYVELCGPVLTLWDASAAGRDIMPQYINITDSTVNIELKLTAETRNNLFSLNSAGANRYLLQAPSAQDLEQWVKAIRLSCFECARIQEIYTYAFITRPLYQSKIMQSSSKYDLERISGFVQVRFPGATGWKKFWAVVSDKLIQKSLFSKKIVQTQGQVMFYESKKAKRPVMTLTNVAQAYTVYPESPKLIQRATLFKLEGSLYKARSNGGQPILVSSSSSALIMTSTTDELVQWLVGIYDIFKLYGRPKQLLNDSSNKQSLDFGKQMNRATRGRLFLELSETSTVNVKQGTNLLDTKSAFNSLLVEKTASIPNINDIPELEIPNSTPQDTAVISITDADNLNHTTQPTITTTAPPSEKRTSMQSTASSIDSMSHNSTKSRAKTLATPLRNGLSAPTLLRNVTYASDMSDEEEEEEDVNDSDSDDSVFNLSKKKNKKAEKQQELAIVTTPTSKSSTEISEASSTTTVPMLLPLINKMSDEEDTTFSDSILNSINMVNTQHHPMQSTNHISKKAKTPSNQHAPSQTNTIYSHNTNQHKRNSRFGPKNESNNSHTSLSSSIHTSSDTTLVSQSSQSPDGKLIKNPAKAPMAKKSKPNQTHSRPSVTNQWPMFSSTTSLHEPDYTPPRSQTNWETASVDPSMMGGAHRETFFSSRDSFQAPFYASSVINGDGRSAIEEDDDDVPIASTYMTQHNLQDRLGNTSRSSTKRMENNARLSYQPLAQKKSNPRGNGMPHKPTLLEEQTMMQERMLLEQRQKMMMQQYVQQPYGNMMPMMPMVDPRMMPMMDPRMMPVMDPRYGMMPMMMPMNTPYGYPPRSYSRMDESRPGSRMTSVGSITSVRSSASRPNTKDH